MSWSLSPIHVYTVSTLQIHSGLLTLGTSLLKSQVNYRFCCGRATVGQRPLWGYGSLGAVPAYLVLRYQWLHLCRVGWSQLLMQGWHARFHCRFPVLLFLKCDLFSAASGSEIASCNRRLAVAGNSGQPHLWAKKAKPTQPREAMIHTKAMSTKTKTVSSWAAVWFRELNPAACSLRNCLTS